MKQIAQYQLRRTITSSTEYKLEIPSEGLYVIEVAARAQSEKQIGTTETDDDDLRVEIDGRRFPHNKNHTRYLDSPAAFSGGTLHGRTKIVFFCLYFSVGNHTITLIPDHHPYVESITSWYITNQSKSLALNQNITAEDSDRRPWLTFVLVDLPLKNVAVGLITNRRFLDSDDVKLIVDNRTESNLRNFRRQLWFWLGSFLKGEQQHNEFTVNRGRETHYIELWSDRTPTLHTIYFDFGQITKRLATVYDPLWTGKFKDDSEQIILARAIFSEARDARLSDQVRIGIGWSIHQRVIDSRWGDTYHDVIVEPAQYSAFNKDDKRNWPFVINPLGAQDPLDKKMWQRCFEIAGQVIAGKVPDPTNGANHYYDISIDPPYWTNKTTFTVQIDTVRFYRL